MPPSFFVPDVADAEAEAIYLRLAQFAGSRQLPLQSSEQRIYSVVFEHDGKAWVATVGDQIREQQASNEGPTGSIDGGRVLAIFTGSPYSVVIDGTRSRWRNPFLLTSPRSVALFSG